MGRKPKTTSVIGSTKTTDLTNVTEVSIAKLQLDAIEQANELVSQLNQVPEAFEKIKEQVEMAKNKLGYDLKAKEVEVNDSIVSLELKLSAEKSRVDEEIVKLSEDFKAEKLQNDRDIEKLTYEHTIAIRDKNKKTADVIAASIAMELVLKTDLETMKKNELTPEKQAKLEADVKSTTEKSLTTSFHFEKKELKSQYEMQIQLLTKELEMTKNSLLEAKATIAKQEEMISKHGGDIQAALSAAKVSLTVPTSDSSRK